jgi:hypothetical protein
MNTPDPIIEPITMVVESSRPRLFTKPPFVPGASTATGFV